MCPDLVLGSAPAASLESQPGAFISDGDIPQVTSCVAFAGPDVGAIGPEGGSIRMDAATSSGRTSKTTKRAGGSVTCQPYIIRLICLQLALLIAALAYEKRHIAA